MKILKFVFALTLVIATGSQILAQGLPIDGNPPPEVTSSPTVDENKINTNDVDVVLTTETQDPGSKEFNIVATITSAIDSDRVIVDWIPDSAMRFSNSTDTGKSSTSIRAGQDTIVKKTFVAGYSGTHEVEVVITAVKADVNYLAADNIELEFNQNLEILPLSDDYKQAKLVHQFSQGILYLAVITTTGAVLFFIYRRIRNIT